MSLPVPRPHPPPERAERSATAPELRPPERSARVRAAVSGMVVLVLVAFSAAVVAAIITPGGERVELAEVAGADAGGGTAGGGAASAGGGVGESAGACGDAEGDRGDGGDRGGGADRGDHGGGTAACGPDPHGGGGATPDPGTVVVHISGAVAHPGVVELLLGARVVDALAVAGGPDADADLAALNLARPLVDGEQVHVPREGEAPPGGQSGGQTGGQSGSGAPGGAAGGGAPPGAAGGLVNLNTAGSAELETLPGVGPALAGRILAWREQNGSFRSVDELLAVSGIGEKTLAGFRDQVTV